MRKGASKAPSSSEEGVGGGGVSHDMLRRRATDMRNNPTEPERKLWAALRRSQLNGFKFRCQYVIGRRIVDFYCPAAKCAIEVDGMTHDREEDLRRDAALEFATGVQTLRFTNEEVMRDTEGVLLTIIGAISKRTTP